jgi:hypothetical protein
MNMERETRIVAGMDSSGRMLFFSAGPESSGLAYQYADDQLLVFVGEDDLLDDSDGFGFVDGIVPEDLKGAKVPGDGAKCLCGIHLSQDIPRTVEEIGNAICMHDAVLRDLIESDGLDAVRQAARENMSVEDRADEATLRRAMRDAVQDQNPVLN